MTSLAILICTLPERFDKLKRLKNILEPQVQRYKERVFISISDVGRQMPTGTKRNSLIEQTQSDYFCFIDDDDQVSGYYVDEIIKALATSPDVVTFQGWMTTNGTRKTNWTIKLGEKYEERNGHYYRWPNHLSVFKRSLVNRFKFPDVWLQEDFIWSKKIHDSGVLKSEVHIPLQLYHYEFEYQDKVNKYQRR